MEAAKRFAAANTDGSDKTSYHSYHLMYGPFLAPYLDRPVVSLRFFNFSPKIAYLSLSRDLAV